MRILLVEDEQSLSETIKLNLEMEGYHVTAIADGRKVLKTFREARYNLILLDVMLPGTDGFTICLVGTRGSIACGTWSGSAVWNHSRTLSGTGLP